MMANLQKKSFFKNYSNANKKAFVFGVAMHTSTDTLHIQPIVITMEHGTV